MAMDLVGKKPLTASMPGPWLAGSKTMRSRFFPGGPAAFGINVFKVREVGRNAAYHQDRICRKVLKGCRLRGNVIPVLSLVNFLEHQDGSIERGKTMMVAEYSKRTLGF